MKIIDRYIVRNFLVSTLLWFVVMMSMRVVIDLFMNMDEFAEHEGSTWQVMGIIAIYYGCQLLEYIAQMGGLVILMGAVTTIFLMNRSNELVALLASGVSLHRVVWPIVIGAMALNVLLIIDQEIFVPAFADRLVLKPDEMGGKRKGFNVRLITDGQRTVWYSEWFNPTTGRMQNPLVLGRDKKLLNLKVQAFGTEARHAKMGDLPGWFILGGRLQGTARRGKVWRSIQDSRYISTYVSPSKLLSLARQPEQSNRPIRNVWASDEDYDMVIRAERFIPAPYSSDDSAAGRLRGGKLERPTFTFFSKLVPREEGGDVFVPAPDARVIGIFTAKSASWQPRLTGKAARSRPSDQNRNRYDHWLLEDGELFIVSDLTPQDLILRKSGRAQQLMSFRSMSKMLRLEHIPNRAGVELTRHARVTDAISNLLMLLLGLPFILSRERNIKASAGLCMLMVGAYYALIYMCRYIGLPPVWAAWLPILLFGPVAVVMLDSVKT